jgi:hypothetical protein
VRASAAPGTARGRFDEFGVELVASLRVDAGERVLESLRRFVGAVVGEGVDDVGERDDPSDQWDVRSGEPVGMARAVPTLMVAACDPLRTLEQGNPRPASILAPIRVCVLTCSNSAGWEIVDRCDGGPCQAPS